MNRPSLDFLVQDYLLALQVAGRAESTLREKEHRLRLFREWLGRDCGRALTLDDVTTARYRAFMAYLQDDCCYGTHHAHIAEQSDRALSPFTLKAYARVIHAWVRWLMAEGYLSEDPLRNEHLPKVPDQAVMPYTDEEVDRILAAVTAKVKRWPAEAWRQLVTVLFLLDTGVRLGEFVGLEDRHLWLSERRCLVTGKGKRDRYVPFGSAVRRYLTHYMERWRPEALGEPSYVFRAPDGGPWSADRVGQVLRDLGRQAGVEEVRAHRFRHTFGYRFIRNGGDVFSLMRILGHTTVKTTMIYVYMQDKDIQDKHRLFSPVDRMRGLPRVK